MKNTLFVYGTLLSNIQSSMAIFLQKNAKFIGEGTLAGQLFDLGHYPGAVFQKEAISQIYGHIFALENPTYSWPILDEYEAVGEQFSQYNEYVREIVPIKMDGKNISCWAYLYALPTFDLPIISSGNYLDFLKNSRKHREFIKSV